MLILDNDIKKAKNQVISHKGQLYIDPYFECIIFKKILTIRNVNILRM